jgi:single-stranded-DNA-specific exonuclease
LGKKKWDIARENWSLAKQMSTELNISLITAQLLISRGVLSASEGRVFLFGTLANLQSPYELLGVCQAVERITNAIKSKERIAVFGDYDADGITATALMFEALELLGARVLYYIPERIEEGYCLNNRALDFLAIEGTSLVITVDCGIKAHQEVAYGKTLGMDFIITDHHEPDIIPPLATAVINPKLPAQNCAPLAGVGVAFKLCQALFERFAVPPEHGVIAGQYLDLLVIGTIADIVPLIGDNRLLVKHGLLFLNKTQRLGLKALIEVAGVSEKNLTTNIISYGLVPRINAAGRISHAGKAVELLLTKSSQRAMELARQLDRENETRQIMEQQITAEALSLIGNTDLEKEKIIVLSSTFWHQGVIGISSAKLAEKYNRPVILFSISANIAKGSARSIAGFPLSKVLDRCKDLVLEYGGHDMAAGLSIEKDNIDFLKKRLNCIAEQIHLSSGHQPTFFIDCEIMLESIDIKLAEEIEFLGPFGPNNSEPLFVSWQVNLQDLRSVGKNGYHLKLFLQDGGKRLEAIGFNLLRDGIEISGKEEVAVVYTINKNYWQGQERVQLVVKDIKPNEFTKFEQDFINHKLDGLSQGIKECLVAWFNGESVMVDYSSDDLLEGIALYALLDWQRSKTCTLIVTESISQIDAYAKKFNDLFSATDYPVFLGYGAQTDNEVLNLVENINNHGGMIILSSSFWRAYHEQLQPIADRIAFLYNGLYDWEKPGQNNKNQLLAVKSQNNQDCLISREIEWERLICCQYSLENLEKVISTGGSRWLLAKNDADLRAIRKYILEKNLVPDKQIFFWWPDYHWRQKLLLSKMLRNIGDYLVLTNIKADFWLEECDRLILWNNPFGTNDLRGFLSWGKEVYLMLKQSIYTNLSEGPSLRTKYGMLYKSLQKAGRGKMLFSLNETQINKILINAGIYFDHLTVKAPAISVLEELGLLRVEQKGSNVLINLLPVPENKKNLEDSWRYLEYRREADLFQDHLQLIQAISLSKVKKRQLLPGCV